MPVMCGSITQSTAIAVTAASTALPPRRMTSMAASVASGCEVAAMPSPAITGERPGRWKSRLMDGPGVRSDGGIDRAVDLDVALRRARGDDEARHHIDQADHHQDEERGRSSPCDQEEFDQHDDEQDHRKDVIHQPANAHPGCLDDLD